MENPHSDHGTVVKPDEAALIVDADGDFKMCMPDYGDDDDVPYAVMVLTALWIKMRDDAEWTQELVEDVFGEN